MADAKVAILNVVPQNRGAPQHNVIEYLEKMLARARAGDVQSIMTAYVRANGMSANGWAYGESVDDDIQGLALALLFNQRQLVRDTSLETVPQPEEPA